MARDPLSDLLGLRQAELFPELIQLLRAAATLAMGGAWWGWCDGGVGGVEMC